MFERLHNEWKVREVGFKGCTMNEKLHDGCHIDKIVTSGWKLHDQWSIGQRKLHNWWIFKIKKTKEKATKWMTNWRKSCIMDEILELYNDKIFN